MKKRLGESWIMEISVHALSGNVTPNTIKLKGLLKKRKLSVLVDSGSTHSFLDPIAARLNNITMVTTPPLVVMVADENRLVSDSKCPAFR